MSEFAAGEDNDRTGDEQTPAIGSVAKELKRMEIRNNVSRARAEAPIDSGSRRPSVMALKGSKIVSGKKAALGEVDRDLTPSIAEKVTESIEEGDEDDHDVGDLAEEDDDEEGEGVGDGAVEGSEMKKKKKKKKNNKKKKKGTKEGSLRPESRLLGGFTDYYVKYGQTPIPSIPIADLFPSGIFPEGEMMESGTTKVQDSSCTFNPRITMEERRESERLLAMEVPMS